MVDATFNASLAASRDELESPARRALRRLFKRKGAVVGLVVLSIFLLLAIFAPLVAPFDPIATSWSLVRKPPSAQHWFGTDELGRDVLARVIHGTRASLLAGVISVSTAPDNSVPSSSAPSVITGVSALRIACLRITDRSERPLARAVRT